MDDAATNNVHRDDIPTGNTLYILLVEDCPSQALQIQHLFETFSGYRVCIAEDGIEGWKKACDDPPPVLILLDVNLPTLDGFSILSLLKHSDRTAAIPVVMLTGLDRLHDVEHAISLGVDGYLFKDDLFTPQTTDVHVQSTIKQFLKIPLP